MSEEENKRETNETGGEETAPEHTFDVAKWRSSMLTATAGVCRELDANEIDEEDYSRIFKATRLIMDPEFDERSPVARGLDNLSMFLQQNPALVAQLFNKLVELGRIDPAFRVESPTAVPPPTPGTYARVEPVSDVPGVLVRHRKQEGLTGSARFGRGGSGDKYPSVNGSNGNFYAYRNLDLLWEEWAPAGEATPAAADVTATVFLTIDLSTGQTTGAIVSSDEWPETDGTVMHARLLNAGASSYAEARKLALETYALAYPDLAKKFPVS